MEFLRGGVLNGRSEAGLPAEHLDGAWNGGEWDGIPNTVMNSDINIHVFW